MATRATYTIDGVNFYCHWDGYPAGAAGRFIAMIEAMTAIEDDPKRAWCGPFQDRRGGAAFAFIRGNLDAEPAWPGGHGDTEFHYEIWTADDGRLHIHYKERHYGDDWNPVDTLTLAEFCNRHGRKFDLPRVVEMREDAYGVAGHVTRYKIATAPTAERAVSHQVARAEEYGDQNPNAKECLKRADAWRIALELDGQPA